MSADAARCRQVVRTHARTFLLASHFLNPEKRRSAFALYAFCRVADDMVDTGADEPDARAARVAEYRARLTRALAGEPDDAIFREVMRALERHHVPAALLHELLDGVTRDCAPSRYASWDELAHYCEGVASSVGEMCTWVFGVDGGHGTLERAVRHARTLGTAMQLTNILRDVGEDAGHGRCYLPEMDLAQFRLTREEILAGGLGADRRWHALMRFEIARARALYDSAMPGISLLAPDARRCAHACAVGYSKILGAIERRGYDVFGGRARLGALERASVLWSAWRGTPGHSTRDTDLQMERRWA